MHQLIVGLASIPLISTALAQSPDRKVQDEPGLFGQTPVVSSSAAGANLFQGAKVKASGQYEKYAPELAVDGKIADEQYWASENLPVWHEIDLGAPKTLESIQLWLYWKDGRIYKYVIEGSLDGKKWVNLVDQKANSIASTQDGSTFNFKPQNVRYVRTTILENSKGKQSGGHIVEIKGFEKPITGTMKAVAVSDLVRQPWTGELTGAPNAGNAIKLVGWKGERVNGQIIVSAEQNLSQLRVVSSPLKGEQGSLPVKSSFVKFTKAQGKPTADIISNTENERLEQQAGINRTVWVSVDIPKNAKPGIYKGKIKVLAKNEKSILVPVEIQVLNKTLPSPNQWKMHLDLWQHPESVARWHGVEAWSPEHFALMKPIMKRLADAGQKVITCSIIDEAWGGQTFDHFPAMIEWIKKKDGTLTWDYTNFDKWVSFMINDVGIKDQISCYTMIPWSMKVRVLNEATGEYEDMDNKPGDPSFEKLWGPFLSDFAKHVKQKGWEDITCIGIDERPDHMVKAAKEVIDKYSPKMKIVSAVNHPSAMSDSVYDLSPILFHFNTVTPEMLQKRKAAGQKTTFYVCCGPDKPNTFTNSPLAESEWMGLFAAANNADGFLRWAYNSWGRNPLETTAFGSWRDGDCYLVYPGNLSSLRFEKLRDGIEEFEKINLLRKEAEKNPQKKAQVEAMDKRMKELFKPQQSGSADYLNNVIEIKKITNSTETK